MEHGELDRALEIGQAASLVTIDGEKLHLTRCASSPATTWTNAPDLPAHSDACMLRAIRFRAQAHRRRGEHLRHDGITEHDLNWRHTIFALAASAI